MTNKVINLAQSTQRSRPELFLMICMASHFEMPRCTAGIIHQSPGLSTGFSQKRQINDNPEKTLKLGNGIVSLILNSPGED
jgi:hypothetical protein